MNDSSRIYGTYTGSCLRSSAVIQTSQAADTWTDILRSAFFCLISPVWIRNDGTSHANQICFSGCNDCFCHLRLVDSSNSFNRNMYMFSNFFCIRNVASSLHVLHRESISLCKRIMDHTNRTLYNICNFLHDLNGFHCIFHCDATL